MNKQHSIAIVNDISGFGRCSITVALPILCAMKIQCGIVPTAILSNHTGYPDYTLLDFTAHMDSYLEKWKSLQFSFDGIYTGYLGSKDQLSVIRHMLKNFDFQKIIVDPVMGDDGVLYPSYTQEMCNSLKQLVTHSTLTTPNVTELCFLTDTPYKENFTEDEIFEMCEILRKNGAQKIVVTGIVKDNLIGNAIYEDDSYDVLYNERILPLRPGTGDVFSAILAGENLLDMPLKESVKTAAHFIKTCLITSSNMKIPINDGVCFEEHLDMLIPKKGCTN